jgi:hypothetical protein
VGQRNCSFVPLTEQFCIKITDDQIKLLLKGINAEVSLDKADGLLGSIKKLF